MILKIENIEAYMEHTVEELMCWKCGRRWIGVYPSKTLLKDLECPGCQEQGYVFATGQGLIEDEE